jgi:hypothetical protein
VVADPSFYETPVGLLYAIKPHGAGAVEMAFSAGPDLPAPDQASACQRQPTCRLGVRAAVCGPMAVLSLSRPMLFQKVRDVNPAMVSKFLKGGCLDRSEDQIQTALEQILGVTVHKKDWGGELNDLYTANVIVRGVRRATAFLLKGSWHRKEHDDDCRLREERRPTRSLVQFAA